MIEEQKIRLVVAGRVIVINDLGKAMNEAFRQLYSSFLSNQPLNFEEFEKIATEFFNSNHIKIQETDDLTEVHRMASRHDQFFSNYGIICQWLLHQRRILDAEYAWEAALKPALTWEKQNPNCRIHKGTAFLFRGGTAINSGNLDKGYLLIHQALEEDKKTHPNARPLPNTPSLVFVTLDYKDPRQPFKVWIEGQVTFIDKLLLEYRNSYGKHLTSDDFRSRFLKGLSEISLIVLFVYTLARFYNLAETPPYAQKSDFAGQLGINLLFDVSLVIDSTIKARNPNYQNDPEYNKYYSRQILHLSDRAGLMFRQSHLDTIGTELKTRPFETILKELLDRNFNFGSGSSGFGHAEVDLAISYLLRNYGAHNVSSVQTVWQRFTELRQSLFNVLFLCVETLYP